MSDAQSKLQIELDLTDKASSKARESTSAFGELKKQIEDVGKVAVGFAIGNLGSQVGIGLADHFKDAITEVENFGQQVFDLQSRLGLTAQSASGLLSVFERFGVSAEQSNRTLDFFSRGLRNNIDATEGGIEAAGNFQGTLAQLGVSATDAQGHFRPVDQVLANVIDRMHSLSSDGQTAARAMALFGRAGGDLAPILNLSKEQFQELQAEAQRLGVTLTQSNVNDIRALAMAHRDLDEATRGLTIQLGLAFVPALRDAADSIAKMLASANQSGAIQAFIGNVKHGVDELRQLLDVARKANDELNAQADKGELNTPSGVGEKLGDQLRKAADAWGEKKDEVVSDLNDSLDHAQRFLQNLNQIAGPGVSLGEAIRGAAAATARQDAENEANQIASHEAIGRILSAQPHPAPGPDATGHPAVAADREDRLIPPDQREGYVAANQRALSAAEQIKQLNVAELAANRELEVIQYEQNRLQREDLDLVNLKAQREADLLPIKQAQADLELQLLETTRQRAQIDRESALQRAQLAGMPASAALEDNQFRQQLLQAQMRAGILAGQGIPNGAIADLMALKRGEAGLQVNALEAGHDVTLAQRNEQAGNLQQQLNTADIRKAQADLALEAAGKQRSLDQVNAELTRQQLEKTPAESGLTKQRQDLEDQLADIHQRQAQLNGANFSVNVQLTVNEATGAPDYDKLLHDLSATVMDAIKRAATRTEAPAPATAPGASY